MRSCSFCARTLARIFSASFSKSFMTCSTVRRCEEVAGGVLHLREPNLKNLLNNPPFRSFLLLDPVLTSNTKSSSALEVVVAVVAVPAVMLLKPVAAEFIEIAAADGP